MWMGKFKESTVSTSVWEKWVRNDKNNLCPVVDCVHKCALHETRLVQTFLISFIVKWMVNLLAMTRNCCYRRERMVNTKRRKKRFDFIRCAFMLNPVLRQWQWRKSWILYCCLPFGDLISSLPPVGFGMWNGLLEVWNGMMRELRYEARVMESSELVSCLLYALLMFCDSSKEWKNEMNGEKWRGRSARIIIVCRRTTPRGSKERVKVRMRWKKMGWCCLHITLSIIIQMKWRLKRRSWEKMES